MGRNVLKSSIKSASFSIVFQIFCRILTFGINAFIVRHVGRDVLGIMNVRLLLLESTLLFLSKEAINRASLSSTAQLHNKSTWPQLINQTWITVPICIVISIPCLYIWTNILHSVDDVYMAQYKFSCYAMVFSCILELCAEAPVFLGQVFCFVKLKIIIDTLHILIRSLVFVVIVVYNNSVAIYAFGIAQFASILTILLSNYLFFHIYIKQLQKYRGDIKKLDDNALTLKYGKGFEHMEDFTFTSVREFLPGVLKNEGTVFNSNLQILVVSFIKQGIFKQVLTEGEKYVMSLSPVLTFSEQATYDIVNNIGSLAARFILRPIEDASYFYFTQTISRDLDLKEQNSDKVKEAANVLSKICRTVTFIGLLALVFGQSYAKTLLQIYGGSHFVESGLPELLLRFHCVAIILLAINGITEGYMFATNTSKEIDTYNYYMAIFSLTFLVLSYQLTNFFGSVGFIMANCCNMLFRMAYSINYIRKQFSAVQLYPLEGLIPGKLFSCVLVIMGIICKISEHRVLQYTMLGHITVGVFCVGLVLVAWGFENREILKIGLKKYRSKNNID